MRWRIAAAFLIGVLSSWLSWYIRTLDGATGAGDFSWAVRAAGDLLAGRDPYNYPYNSLSIPYPLPAAFVGLPFLWVPSTYTGPLFLGISSGLLAFGLTRFGLARLLIFLASPFPLVLLVVQWSPLIMAAAFFSFLWPVVLIKPQVALPVTLTHISRVGMIVAGALLLLSLALMPTWPLHWISQIGSYQRFIPLLTLIGPILLLALLRWRSRAARLLLLAAMLPQRALYDAFILWLIPETPREILATVVASWLVFALPFRPPEAYVVLLSCYLPMLCVILFRRAVVPRIVIELS